LDFLDRFFIDPQTSNFMEILPVGAKLSFTDEQRNEHSDMTNVIVAFPSWELVRMAITVPELFILYPRHKSDCTVPVHPTLEVTFFITNLMHKLLVYLHIIHKLKSSTCLINVLYVNKQEVCASGWW